MGSLQTMWLFTTKKPAEKFGWADAALMIPRRLHTPLLNPKYERLDAPSRAAATLARLVARCLGWRESCSSPNALGGTLKNSASVFKFAAENNFSVAGLEGVIKAHSGDGRHGVWLPVLTPTGVSGALLHFNAEDRIGWMCVTVNRSRAR